MIRILLGDRKLRHATWSWVRHEHQTMSAVSHLSSVEHRHEDTATSLGQSLALLLSRFTHTSPCAMPAKIASPSVGHVDWMLLGRCTGTSAPSFARPIADDQEPVSLSIDSTVTVYLPCKKVFLLIADLHQSDRSKTLACAFPDNGVAYKLDVSQMTSFSESNERF
jgi:hypothetical protein